MRNFSKLLETSPEQMVKHQEDEVENNAGGFVFKVDAIQRLRRFLIIGSDSTYYATAQDNTRQNVDALKGLITTSGVAAVELIREVSFEGLAPKNTYCLLALACALSVGDEQTRKAAVATYLDIARIPTHQFAVAEYMKLFGRTPGDGSTREMFAKYYWQTPVEKLAYHVLKYQRRVVQQGKKDSAWTHRDMLRISHPKTTDPVRNAIFKTVCVGEAVEHLPPIFAAARECLTTENRDRAVELIREFGLTHEMVSTKVKDDPFVWAALLEKMPMTAMIRNLGKMTSVKLLKEHSAAAKRVSEKLCDVEILRAARIHPLQMLSALIVYKQGHGVKGNLEWTPVPEIEQALEAGFYLAFETIKPTGKRLCLALDVSGSMGWQTIQGIPGMTPRTAAAVMAMVTVRSEKDCKVVAFSHNLQPLTLHKDMRLEEVTGIIDSLSFGATDCALPMTWAKAANERFDGFVVYTDSETWAGDVHPDEALRQYRAQSGIKDSCLAVVAFTASDFTIADPKDPRMLDFVGFDSSGPAALSDFIAGRF